MRHAPLIATCLFVGISLACSGGTDGEVTVASPAQTEASDFPAAPELGVTDWVRGEPVSLADADNVVLVEHWATWCGPCRIEMPHLTALQEEHADKLVVVALSDEARSIVAPFVDRNEEVMQYTVAAAEPSAMMAWSRMAGADSIPYSYLVRDGQIVWHGHPARMAPVLAPILDGNWTPELARTVEELPSFVPAYLETLDLTGPEAARHLLEPVLELPQLGADTKNELSWTILTEVPEDKRDLPLALQLAEQATAEVDHSNWAYEDTLGLAYFVNGRLPEAIEAQAQAVALCEKAQAGHPCIEIGDRLTEFREAL